MPESPESGWSPKQRTAIFAAAHARGLDTDAVRGIARERFGVAGLRELTREQAHQLLDVLNGKDPEKESRKRRWLCGPVKRGERPPAAKRDGAASGAEPDASASDVGPARRAGDEGAKVLRPASDEQWGLLRSLAFRVGLTRAAAASGDGTFVLDLDALARWMRWKLGGAWKVLGEREKTRRVMADSLARKAIHALRDWEKWRLSKWEKAHGRDAANAVLDAGLPNEWDKKLPLAKLDDLPADVAAALAGRKA